MLVLEDSEFVAHSLLLVEEQHMRIAHILPLTLLAACADTKFASVIL